uniref:W2 domain-containing protein n=1 Tax=Strigamia maritima TaxID=126957 RepID=T1IZF4_STRMM
MSQKVEKPSLSGQRLKTRKRDEKEKYDPAGFRDSILQGLFEAGTDLDAVTKFLDAAGSKLDYRRYGETLFDILIAGGILEPGGSIIQDADPNKISRTEVCVFCAPDDSDALKGYTNVFYKLIRRYKYLEKMFEDEMKKVLLFLKGYGEIERHKLAIVTALLLTNALIPAAVLGSLFHENLVKDGIALDFVIEVFQIWINEKDIGSLTTALRKAGLENRLMDFFPINKRSFEAFERTFKDKGLGQLVEFQKAQENAGFKRELQKQLTMMIRRGDSSKDIITSVREYVVKYAVPDQEIVVLIWNTIMGAVEWNKKEELVADQALKHLKLYSPLLTSFTTQDRSELALIIKVQEFCFENMNFMKVFSKIVVLFYKTEVLSEDVILKWYNEAHSTKGKSVFLEQMKKFVEWLKNAEEESESGEDDD